ncbi:MAG: F420-nonreducing hydrogenase [Candidatus Methanomethylicota archaeon]|uniref:F420-nonreducing hydrogenase n=1 Tax=Thermoproteota archaeon TaxID=2056631 RepID=A0A497EQ53_9CREN|nr:MAG: F420-nonreducing hydrogenase [Candidatus Verstraetearchaeota archaeon]RLE53453.1 MAG: F420-nonreducing hydrogenase [Candidatus Verstraetearchaeota archaeon]
MPEKVKVVNEWLCVCSGCEISLLNIHEKLLNLLDRIEIVHSPVLMDVKEIPEADIALVSGGVRNWENVEVLKEVREKCRILIALGSCAAFGGIPGLGNLFSREELLRKVYIDTKSTDNPNKVLPCKEVPPLTKMVAPIWKVVKTDYVIPGCPPEADLIWDALSSLLDGKEPCLSTRTVCDECPLKKEEKKEIKVVKRWYEASEGFDPERCLLEQGFVCMGPATRAGCGAKCPQAHVPCRGCMGPAATQADQAASMIGALGFLEVDPELLVKKVADPVGLFYRYTLPSAIIPRYVEDRGGETR